MGRKPTLREEALLFGFLGLVAGVAVGQMLPISGCLTGPAGLLLANRLHERFRVRRAKRILLGDEDEVPVHATVSRRGEPLGIDDGLLSLDDGWLHFRGAKGEWSLAHPDTRHEPSGRIGFGPDGDALELEPLGPDDGRLRDLIEMWRLGPTPVGRSVFPSTHDPETDEWRAFRRFLGVSLCFVPSVVAASEAAWEIALILALTGLVPAIVLLRRTARPSARSETARREGKRESREKDRAGL